MVNEGMTPADLAAVTRNNNGGDAFGGNGAWWIIVLFLFMWGRGSWGGADGNAFQGYATRADIQEGFATNSIQSGIQNLQNSMCESTYAVTNAVNNGFSANQLQLCNGFNSLQAQLAQCCCDNKSAIADLKYTMATESCANRTAIGEGVRDIIDSQRAGVQTILDKMCQSEIDALKQRNTDLLAANGVLQNQISQNAQNAFITQALANQTAALSPTPVPAYVVQNPNCCGSYAGCGSY